MQGNRLQVIRWQQGQALVEFALAPQALILLFFGITLAEAQRGTAYFRLWRFYPGPPPTGGIE